MKKLNKKGFTIVELVIVITVIAILSAVLIPTFTSVVKNSKNSAAVQDARNAYTEYLAENAADPAEDFIYAYDEDRFVVIKGGQFVEEEGEVKVFATEDLAKAVLGCSEEDIDAETEGVQVNYETTEISANFKAYAVTVAEGN